MAENGAADEGVSVVFVDDSGSRAIVPVDVRSRLLARPGGSVTVEGMRRAAKQILQGQDPRGDGPIAEATLGDVEAWRRRWTIRRDEDVRPQ